MVENKDKTVGAGSKPKWWTESFETSWKKARAEVMADWDKVVAGEKKLEHSIAEEALAFGHGARDAYRKMEVWGSELEDKLKADWKETGHDAASAWDKVSAAVKQGWERAATTTKSAVAAVTSPATRDARDATDSKPSSDHRP